MKEQPISVENLMAADEATNANLDAGSILSRAVAAAEEADLLEGESLGANESEISWMQARWEGRVPRSDRPGGGRYMTQLLLAFDPVAHSVCPHPPSSCHRSTIPHPILCTFPSYYDRQRKPRKRSA